MGYTLNTETGFLDLGASSVDIKGTYVTRLVAPCHVLYGDGRGGGGRETPIDSALEQVRYHQSMPLAVAPYVLRRSVVGLQSLLHVDLCDGIRPRQQPVELCVLPEVHR